MVTTQFVPTGDTSRIVWLSVSATYRLPALSIATPTGKLKRAALFVPFALPELRARPARVVTTQLVPTCVTFRIVEFPSSAT